ncbi:MAG: KpsF/GutQ family sugar-phosphate isomerase [Pelagibacteraceae bacterium]|nr:KpsF/GutQ family sugar-phosphate isomerase [Pelagibacteraceae bacterium]PPR10837.1 MAG: Arabinose 5-phosphate isomerase KdsD [Alphaproteobacteria bacterium MarineAlpha11_Bin1]|tara:strand:- start:5300 stop:6298 length:999 start_codon:yes stop_codon:yes gene_type:complete
MSDTEDTLVDNICSSSSSALESARRVLDVEISGLQALSRALDARFTQAVVLLGNVEGRVIVTGMGKSGHIARKIAATLASTGTPSQYVHPGEASHGDLGMITSKDAVIAMSNSGETAELSDIVAYVKLKRIPLISITGRPDSVLAEAADVSLLVPDSPEACPLSLAPTTSTTVMLVLGDAIAVTLLERRGFSPDDFHLLHPGGQLGSRLIRADDIMRSGRDLPLVSVDTPMAEAIIEMTAKQLGCVGVSTADGKLVGVITDGDLRRHMEGDILAMMASEVMTADPKTVGYDSLAAQVLAMMNENKITTSFVVAEGEPLGIIHIHDILRTGLS